MIINYRDFSLDVFSSPVSSTLRWRLFNRITDPQRVISGSLPGFGTQPDIVFIARLIEQIHDHIRRYPIILEGLPRYPISVEPTTQRWMSRRIEPNYMQSLRTAWEGSIDYNVGTNTVSTH
jgi:hypothetical protein